MWEEKVVIVVLYGCICFDGVIWGYGGCLMVKDDFIGNMFMEYLVYFF